MAARHRSRSTTRSALLLSLATTATVLVIGSTLHSSNFCVRSFPNAGTAALQRRTALGRRTTRLSPTTGFAGEIARRRELFGVDGGARLEEEEEKAEAGGAAETPSLPPRSLVLVLRREFATTVATTAASCFAAACARPATARAAAAAAANGSKDLSEEYRQGTAALGGTDEAAPVPREAYKKLPSGVIYADLRTGPASAPTVAEGSRVNIQWVLRKSNGYFVDSSERNGGVPFIFTCGDGSAIRGLDEAVRGMRQGGARRVLIPPSLAYVQGLEDGMPGPLPVGYGPRQQMRRVQTVRKDVPGEYIFLEVQATRVVDK